MLSNNESFVDSDPWNPNDDDYSHCIVVANAMSMPVGTRWDSHRTHSWNQSDWEASPLDWWQWNTSFEYHTTRPTFHKRRRSTLQIIFVRDRYYYCCCEILRQRVALPWFSIIHPSRKETSWLLVFNGVSFIDDAWHCQSFFFGTSNLGSTLTSPVDPTTRSFCATTGTVE